MSTTEPTAVTETTEERHARERRESVAGLRALADVLERAGDNLPVADYVRHNANAFLVRTKDEAAAIVRTFARHGWLVEKVYNEAGDHRAGGLRKISLTVPGGGTTWDCLVLTEQVCTRKVVGQEEVEVPDYSQPVPMKRELRDIVEWECEPLLARTEGDQA